MNRFIIDTQLPPILAEFLRKEGFIAIHTSEYQENGHLLKDSEITKIAIQENLIIITKDSDFLDDYFLKGSPPKLIHLAFGNIKNSELITLFDQNLTHLINLLEENYTLIAFNRNKIVGY